MRGLAILFVTSFALACGSQDVHIDGGTTDMFVQLRTQPIDKVDLLFAIDNSASMGDKQDLLAGAVPAFVRRLLNPNCVTTTACSAASDCNSSGAGATCDLRISECVLPGDGNACQTIPGTKLEFAAVHDMHIGIVSSSLGGGGSPDICLETGSDATHNNDHGHLLNRTVGSPEGSIAHAKPSDGNGGNFLAWLPAEEPMNVGKDDPNVSPYNSATQSAALITDFQALVEGTQQHGCGLEAQLESWYRFLVQPDPYDTLQHSSDDPPKVSLDGVDVTLLKMRHDFLRPDSLVAIIQITDEEDSWSDPLWLGGFGWTVRTQNFPAGPGNGAGPRGTSECDEPVDMNNVAMTGPNNPDCSSCAFPTSEKPVAKTLIGDDPNCKACAGGQSTCPMKGWYTPASSSVPIAAADGLNARYTNNMRARYGLDPQFNIQRYVDGLQMTTVPDRDHEVHDSAQYASETQRNCTNPLFASSLPDGSDTSNATLCNLAVGSRTPDLVYYALIGGVPPSLTQDASGNIVLDHDGYDWTAMLGKDPGTFQLDGIDPHMIESTAPRAGLQGPGASYNLGADPVNGREWNTLTSSALIDLEYACTFDLPTPKDCNAAANANACDCVGSAASSADGPPLCSLSTRSTQIRGKAYPTIRELRVAKGLGSQAVVASICAAVVTGSTSSPAYGYNPAMQAIIDRMRGPLNGSCSGILPSGANGGTSCQLFVVYTSQTDQSAGCTDPGTSQPSDSLLAEFKAQFGQSPAPVVCAYQQLFAGSDFTGSSCNGASANGWCYVDNDGVCAHAIDFSQGAPTGVELELLCVK